MTKLRVCIYQVHISYFITSQTFVILLASAYFITNFVCANKLV